MKKLTYEYIKEQIEKEGYELLSKEYINSKTKLDIECKFGHVFHPTWNDFQRGSRCRICFYKNNREKNKFTYDFVNLFFKKEGYKLLSKKYIDSQTKLDVKCPNGHIFHPTFGNFKNGETRCPFCSHGERGKKQRLSHKYIKEQIENEGYELLSKEYINNSTKMDVKCSYGHLYHPTWNDFQQGSRCPFCSNDFLSKKFTYSHEYIKEQIENEGYELLSKEYKNSKEKLKVRCDKGHEYWIRWNDIQQGHGCPFCNNGISKQEEEIAEYIKSLGIDILIKDRSIIKPLELDIVIPKHKIAIEHCGLYWHSEAEKNKNYHKNKLEKTNEAGYRLITIFGDEWIHKKEIVKSRIRYFLGLNKEKVYARKCTIREISREQAKEFIDKYHIQGFASATIYLGAFYKEKTSFGFEIPKLVAVNTFVKRGLTYELNRFCVNNSIIGIASKFLKHFQRNYKWEKITTFADLRWSEGNLYEKIGFIKDKVLRPDYSYFNHKNIRYHKFNFRHKQMKNKLDNYNPNLSEHKNMLNNNYYRIYDCGKIRYEIKNI